jgi:GMP synthase-like glutamine amidotransferase
MRGLILQHGDWAPPGLLADWARARGIPFDVHRADLGESLPTLDDRAFVASLGDYNNPDDRHVEYVEAERRFVEQAVERDVPVLGLCFGGQMLAVVLGGEIEPVREPELGWHTIDSTDPGVPEGPWLQWHYDRFTLPPGAVPLATSPAGVQAFSHGRHLGVQFHPESTIEIVRGWAASQRDRLRELGIDDGDAFLERDPRQVQVAADAAFRLFDTFRERAAVLTASAR